MSLTAFPCADISPTIARRSLTGSFAVRVMRCSFCPSAHGQVPDEHLRMTCHHHLLSGSTANHQPRNRIEGMKLPGQRFVRSH